MNRVLENNRLRVTVSDDGAELVSVWDKKRNAERIWRGDKAVWGRHAPVLFPFVGKVADGRYSYRGKQYNMTSHGFARDRVFELVEMGELSVTHVLKWSEDTLDVYPFKFVLYVKHSLENAAADSVKIEWRVVNEADNGEVMLYGIGGHPAFTFPDNEQAVDCSLRINSSFGAAKSEEELLKYHLLNASGCIDMSREYELDMSQGSIKIKEDMFDKDALIVLDNQVNYIELLDVHGKPYIGMACEGFPYFGIWSKKVDEFICLEPWYGIADVARHEGDLEKKAGMQRLGAGESASYDYVVEFY